jgi:hypothetical protein
MILPSKHFSESRALITVGASILAELENPRSVSELWEKLRSNNADDDESSAMSFDWFTLGLTFLFTIQAVEMHSDGLIAVLTSESRARA